MGIRDNCVALALGMDSILRFCSPLLHLIESFRRRGAPGICDNTVALAQEGHPRQLRRTLDGSVPLVGSFPLVALFPWWLFSLGGSFHLVVLFPW